MCFCRSTGTWQLRALTPTRRLGIPARNRAQVRGEGARGGRTTVGMALAGGVLAALGCGVAMPGEPAHLQCMQPALPPLRSAAFSLPAWCCCDTEGSEDGEAPSKAPKSRTSKSASPGGTPSDSPPQVHATPAPGSGLGDQELFPGSSKVSDTTELYLGAAISVASGSAGPKAAAAAAEVRGVRARVCYLR